MGSAHANAKRSAKADKRVKSPPSLSPENLKLMSRFADSQLIERGLSVRIKRISKALRNDSSLLVNASIRSSAAM